MMTHLEPPDKSIKVAVWKIEEKQTDVNLALAMYRDAAKGHTNTIVLCSNDSDLVPAIKAIREDFPHIEIGIVAPVAPHKDKQRRYTNAELQAIANWTRHHLPDHELEASQLPAVISTKKKAARKPSYW